MEKEKELLCKQLELLAEKSKDCEASDLSMLTKDMLNISFELRQESAQVRKTKDGYDGEIRIKTKIDQSAVKTLSKRISEINKKLEETARLMKRVGK